MAGVHILDPRPNDIVPVILRAPSQNRPAAKSSLETQEHLAKKRQDAGRSVKEVALACPGCEELEVRSSDACETLRIFQGTSEVQSGCSICTSFMHLSLSENRR